MNPTQTRLQRPSRTIVEWDEVFKKWSMGPGKTETEKCENTEVAIRNAIAQSELLRTRKIRVFAQGSYRNRTNVRQDSDVDICVLCLDYCYTDYSGAEGMNDVAAGLSTVEYTYASYKNEVQQALNGYFGAAAVSRGNKAIDVHANSYRVDADVVPCFEHRRYDRHGRFISGTELQPDRGGRITNWPDQQYENGVAKHARTKLRYKKIVRILKNLRYEMADEGIGEAAKIPSYLVECLVWNVPDEFFTNTSFVADVRAALFYLWWNTRDEQSCKEWGEVNELKYLFRAVQPWTREQANAFLASAWSYIGFST